ncbi:hypothetical protein ATHEMM101B_04105 [Atlantibacter hermannii]
MVQRTGWSAWGHWKVRNTGTLQPNRLAASLPVLLLRGGCLFESKTRRLSPAGIICGRGMTSGGEIQLCFGNLMFQRGAHIVQGFFLLGKVGFHIA